MKDPWTVDVRFADGAISQTMHHSGASARDFAKRMNYLMNNAQPTPNDMYRITGVMVWKSHKSDQPAVVYGEAFTY